MRSASTYRLKALVLAGIGYLLFNVAANAACPYSLTNFHNGDPANADQVMGNFNYILGCPNFTGNVGIGTSNPGATLDLLSTGAAIRSTTVEGNYAFLSVNSSSGNKQWGWEVVGNNMAFREAGVADRLTIQAGGNVGIGTPNPGATLDLLSTGTAIKSTTADGNYAFLSVNSDSGNKQWGWDVVGNNMAFREAGAADRLTIQAGGNVGIGISNPEATLDLLSTGTAIKSTTADGNYAFLSVNSGSGNKQWGWEVVGNNMAFREAGAADRLTIQAGGNVGIATAVPAQALEVNGKIKVDSLATATGTALCINAGVLANCSSSRRYKEQISAATFGLKEIMAMRPVTFKWKGRNERDFGLIAEEVAKIDPRFITHKDGKIEGVKYSQLTAVLVNAVKDLNEKYDRQTAILRAQASEIALLRRQNTQALARLDKQSTESREINSRFESLERKLNLHAANAAAPSHQE